MESTLADVRQLFNVKEIAFGVKLENLKDGQFGIFEEGSETSIAATITSLDKLPEKFRIVSKLNGKTYYSFDTIEKKNLRNVVAQDYKGPTVNIWKGVIDNCACTKNVTLIVNIDEEGLIQRDGQTWKHRDVHVVVTNEELDCACGPYGSGERNAVLENNIMTQLMIEKINREENDFYTAEAQKPGGTVVTDFKAFIDGNTVAKEMLSIVLKGKLMKAAPYMDLDENYLGTRGVRIQPHIMVDGKAPLSVGQSKAVIFEETQSVAFELNAGADLRREEFDCMNYYTNLNYRAETRSGRAHPNLVYQFENAVNYNVINLEFTTPNVERNSGRSRLFGVMLASDTAKAAATHTKLKALFGIK